MKDRSLFVITSLNSGGLENYLLRYLNYDTDREVDILCKSGIGGALEDRYLNRLSPSNIIKRKIGYFNIFDFIWFYKLLKKNNYNVVCDFTGNFAGIPMVCAKLANISKRISFYRNSANHFKNTWYNRLYDSFVKRLVFKYSTRILSNSNAAFDYYFPKIKDKRFSVIYNGINTSCLSGKTRQEMRCVLGIPQDAFVVGHTARLDSAKNHDMIIKVGNELCAKYPNLYFVLVGKGVKGYASTLNHHPHIIVHDFRNDILDVLKAFDMYYFPSLWEGQPNALIEALINDLPFVASNIPAIKESVPHDLYTYLCPPDDYRANLNLIETLFLDDKVREASKCGTWARDFYDSDKRFGEFKYVLNNG